MLEKWVVVKLLGAVRGMFAKLLQRIPMPSKSPVPLFNLHRAAVVFRQGDREN